MANEHILELHFSWGTEAQSRSLFKEELPEGAADTTLFRTKPAGAVGYGNVVRGMDTARPNFATNDFLSVEVRCDDVDDPLMLAELYVVFARSKVNPGNTAQSTPFTVDGSPTGQRVALVQSLRQPGYIDSFTGKRLWCIGRDRSNGHEAKCGAPHGGLVDHDMKLTMSGNFVFSVVARVYYKGVVRDYSYDPEMDVT